MSLDRRSLLALAAAAPFAARAEAPSSLIVDLERGPDDEIDLWPEGPPGGENVAVKEWIDVRANAFNLPDRAAVDVTRPTLALFRAKRPDGSAILIIPGGGYRWVVIEKEGWESARLFNRGGATVYVLKYRLPHNGWAAGADAPLQDAQRAMRLIRARAGADKIDPARIAVLGFSAGGHLAGSLAAHHDKDLYAPVDDADADAHSARPDIAGLVYPVATMRTPFAHQGSREHLLGAAPSDAAIAAYSLESAEWRGAPPCFLLHAADDASVPVENAIDLYAVLRAAEVPAEMHLLEAGGHGFGLRGIEGRPAQWWPSLFLAWGAGHGVFGSRE